MAYDFNLDRKYDELLELAHLTPKERNQSLRRIFDRDIVHHPNFNFRGKKINPIKPDEPALDTLFHHLTTKLVDEKIRSRDYEPDRSMRLHWIKHHVEEKSPDRLLIFSVEERTEVRTYIFDQVQKYVIILSPYRNKQEYYLLTAYYLRGRNDKKIKNKYKRRLPDIY